MKLRHVNALTRNVVYLKFFFGMIGVAALSIIVLSSSLFFWFRDKTIKDIESANHMALSNISILMANYLSSAERIVTQLYQSPYVIQLINTNNTEWNNNMIVAANSTVNVISANLFIDSIYVYGKNGLLLKASNSTIPEEYEAYFQKLINTERPVQAIPLVLKRNAKENLNVVSFFYGEKAYGNKNFDDAVLVNINMDMIQSKIFPGPLEGSQEIFIMDPSGRILLDNDMAKFCSNVSELDYVQKILKENAKSGSFTTMLQHRRYTVNYLYSSEGKYYVVHVLEYGQSVRQLTFVRNIIIGLSIFLLLCVLVISLQVSYRIYTPIDNIFKNIRSMFLEPAQNTSRMNELQIVSNATQKIIEKMNNYEREQENRDIRKLLNQAGDKPDGSEYAQVLQKVHLYAPLQNPYCVIVLRICGFKNLELSNTAGALEFQAASTGNIASEYLNNRFTCRMVEVDSEHVALITAEKGEPGSESLSVSSIKPLLAEASDTIYRMLNLEVTIGISPMDSSPERLGQKYKAALQATNYRLFLGRQAIIDESGIIAEDKRGGLDDSVEQLLAAVKKQSRENYAESFKKVFGMLQSMKYEISLHILTQTAIRIMKASDIARTDDSVTGAPNYADVGNQLLQLEDPSEAEEWFLQLFENVSEKLSVIQNANVYDITAKALDYIQRNYFNPDVTASFMADKLSISPSYFSRIFREHTGTSFPDFINNVRLEKSKELLMQNLNQDIAQIGEKVGYSNASYYTAAFKKKYGVTPSKFKLNVLSNSNREE